MRQGVLQVGVRVHRPVAQLEDVDYPSSPTGDLAWRDDKALAENLCDTSSGTGVPFLPTPSIPASLAAERDIASRAKAHAETATIPARVSSVSADDRA